MCLRTGARTRIAGVHVRSETQFTGGFSTYPPGIFALARQKEEEAARIITAAYEDVDRMIKRATLSPEDLKQFSTEILAKDKADMEIRKVSQQGLDWVRAYRRRIPIREVRTWTDNIRCM